MARKTKNEEQELLRSYMKSKELIESMPPAMRIINAFTYFSKLSSNEQIRVRREWDEYYKKCQSTSGYQIFQEQRIALENKDMKRVRELAEDSKKMIEDGYSEIPIPKGIDPWEFEHSGYLATYLNLISSIKKLTEYPVSNKEAQEVWS
jgi:hypothetical protein